MNANNNISQNVLGNRESERAIVSFMRFVSIIRRILEMPSALMSHPRSFLFGLIVILTSWGGFFTLLWTRIFFWDEFGLNAGWIGVWADWSVHATYASVFAFRPWQDWLLGHPLYVGKKFTYPFAADAISGLLMRFGWDAVSAFVIPSILTTLALLALLYAFYYICFRSSRKAFVAVTLFITSGGLGFLWWMKEVWQTKSWEAVLFPPREYTHMGEITLEWINVVSGQLVPQRALLLALPVTLAIILYIQREITRKYTQNFSPLYFGKVLLLSLVSSLLLFLHVHSFIVLVFLCAIWFLLTPVKWRFWISYGVMAGVFSLIFFSLLYGGEIGAGFFKWFPGWLANEKAKNVSWWWFWLLNWGLFLPVALVGSLKKKWLISPFVITGWFLFFACNLILFQPYDWDNSKILTWSYLFLVIPVTDMLFSVWRVRAVRFVGPFLAILLFMTLSLSGFLDIWRLSQTEKLEHLMWSYDDLQLAAQFREITQPTDRVLVSDKHNHWVSTWTGRPVLLGYRGWMWTYGITYTDREKDMFIMFGGGDEAEVLLDTYDIRYVVIGMSERADWLANEAYFAQKYPVILQNAEYSVYKVR